MYAPKRAAEIFESNIRKYQKFLEENFFEGRVFARRIRQALPSEGYYIDPYLCFHWAYNGMGISSLRQFQRIYKPVTCDIRICVTKELFNVKQDYRDYIPFINQMFPIIDQAFHDIEKESNNSILFLPQSIVKLKNDKKASLLDTIADTSVLLAEASI